jgi:hypothetical protein
MTDDEIPDAVDKEKEYAEHLDKAYKLLPAEFVSRMMDDVWSFGLLLAGGQVLGVAHIDDVRQAADGSLWLEVELLEVSPVRSDRSWGLWSNGLVLAPTSRIKASVAVAHVVCAVELADT